MIVMGSPVGSSENDNFPLGGYLMKITLPERIYNPITAMGFSKMFNFQLDNTKR